MIALVTGVLLLVTGALGRLEQDSLDLRYRLRPAHTPADVAVVAIDTATFSHFDTLRWPYPRVLHARAIDRLTAAGARAIVYDVQFTEQSRDPRQDMALYDAVARSRRVVLATTAVRGDGQHRVLGGEENLRAAHARAGMANLPTQTGEVIRRYRHSLGGLESLAVAAAERATGREIPLSRFDGGEAWIDYAGPPGTIQTTSFADLLSGRTPASAFRDRVVVIGATDPTLQDMHPTPMADDAPMAGAEVQANAILTALEGNPLRSAPVWADLLAVVVAALLTPALALRLRLMTALGLTGAAAVAFAVLSEVLFRQGVVTAVVAPLAALVTGAVAASLARYLAETRARLLYARYSGVLEREVAARTAELRATQREILERLGRAADWRETETGRHVERVSRLCEALALAHGLPAAEADRIRVAATLHDIGKIGVPDRVLLKEGGLDEEEWGLMRGHTIIASEILGGSSSPLVRAAEEIARTHHERWDGGGYPDGLAGERIPLSGRICAICDVFDALLSRRSYKRAWSLEMVMEEITAQAGTHFDPALVAAFTRIAEHQYRELGYAERALDDAPMAGEPSS